MIRAWIRKCVYLKCWHYTQNVQCIVCYTIKNIPSWGFIYVTWFSKFKIKNFHLTFASLIASLPLLYLPLFNYIWYHAITLCINTLCFDLINQYWTGPKHVRIFLSTEQHTFKNVMNCLNTNIHSYLETSGGQSSNSYDNVFQFRVN